MKKVSEKNLKLFEMAAKSLHNVIQDCKKENPDCFAYLDGSQSIYLLDGTKEIGEEGVEETILADSILDASGGDW